MKSNEAPTGSERVLLTSQKWMAVVLLVLFIVPIGLYLIAFPNRVGFGTFIAGGVKRLAGLAAHRCRRVAFDKVFRKPISAALFAAFLVAAASLAAFGIARFRSQSLGGTACATRFANCDCLAASVRKGF
jgi:hypothetical protein